MKTFKGGIHPNDNKYITKDLAIEKVQTVPEMVYPVSQHLGAPATPIVKVGDEIKMGQVIAEANGMISANVLSGVSGKVKAIEKRLDIGGNMSECIVIENDFLDNPIDNFGKKSNYLEFTNEEIINKIKEAGIVGLGGAGFPTHIKLSPKDPEKIDYILVNGAECEPYLTSDYRLMIEQSEKLLMGLKVVLKLFPNAKGRICIEKNKPYAIKKLNDLVKDEKNIDVFPMETKYPQGGERQLIFVATNRKINSSILPAMTGVIVDNVDTMISIYNAICENTPLIRRIMTISGDCFNKVGNYEVRLGMDYQSLIDQVGGFCKTAKKIVSGGPMMGICIYNLQVPVAKNSSAVVSFSKDDSEEKTTSCINCGRCVDVCPENLLPTLMEKASKILDYDKFNELYGMECIECGSCAYVCPAKRPLTQSFKIMKRKTGAYLKEKNKNTNGVKK
ncbi:MAG: electron transport complex subunit RsxC [Eubacteriales bacterium]|nr:electron transport complex subunit RsxC [Eubacteriales bacterium]